MTRSGKTAGDDCDAVGAYVVRMQKLHTDTTQTREALIRCSYSLVIVLIPLLFPLEPGACFVTSKSDSSTPLELYEFCLSNPSYAPERLRNDHYYSPRKAKLLALNRAACRGNAVRVRELLATGLPVNYTIVGCSSLHCALEHPDIVQELLARHADTTQRDFHDNSPLHYAARWGKITVVKALLNAGADPKLLNQDRLTPLHEAVAHNQHEVFQEILKRGTGVRWALPGPTLVHAAIESGSLQMVHAVLKVLNCIDELFINLPDKWGETALYCACWHGHLPIMVNALLKAGADVNLHSSPLLAAVRRGYLDITQALLAKGADVNAQDRHKEGPLHLTCQKGDAMLLILLLRAGACPDLQDETGETALHLAASEGQLAMVHALVQYGASGAICDTTGRSPLHRIAASDRDERGENSLVSRSTNGSGLVYGDEPDAEQDQLDADIAELLIQAGANINQIDEGGRTPLLYAARAGKVALVKLLLCQGADVHIYTGRGNGPLHNAANKQVVELLLQAGANIEELNVCGRTPVMNSVRGIVEELFGRGDSFPTKELDTRISVDQEIENVLKQSKPIAHQWAWELQQLLLSENVTQMSRLAPDLVTLICTFATNVKPKRVPNLSDR